MALRERYEVDAKQAERAFKSLAAAQKALGTEVDQTGKRLTKAEREARKFAEKAEPTKRVERNFRELAAAVNKGSVSLADAQKISVKYQRQLEGVTKAGNDAFGLPMVQKVTSVAGVVGGLLATARLYTRELEAQQALFDRRVGTQVTVEQSRAAVRRNMAGMTDAEIIATQARASQIATRNGISEAFVNQGLSEALSASGGKVNPSVAAVALAARYVADSPAEIGQIAGTLIDLSKVTGSTDADTNLGLLTAVGAAGRVVDPRLQAVNIAPALVGAKTFGGTAVGAGSLFAALTSAGADTTGARTGTGLIALAQQLEAFDQANASFDSTTLRGRVEALQRDRQLAQQFLGSASFEKQIGGLVRDLLTDSNSVAATEFRNNLQAFPSRDNLAARGRDAVRKLSVGNDLAPVAARGRLLERAREESQLRRPSRQLSAAEIENVKVLLQELGTPRLGVDAATFLGRLDGDGITGDEVSSALRARASSLRADRFTGLSNGPSGIGLVREGATEASLAAAEALITVAEKLDQLVDRIDTQRVAGE